MQLNKRKCFFVLGMHRSGTSTIAGALSQLGFDLGNETYPPRYDNPKGFFENIALNQFNDYMLSLIGASWDDTFKIQQGWENFDIFIEQEKILMKLIISEFGFDTDIVIKDPRICILLPFYQKVLLQLNYELYAIICLRHPIEVAKSLNFRDNFAISQSFVLYMDYLLKVELFSRSLPRVFIKYEKFIDNPEIFIDVFLKSFNIPKSNSHKEKVDKIKSFVEKNLRHHKVKQDDSIPDSMMLKLYNLLSKIESSPNVSDDRQQLVALDTIRVTFQDEFCFYNGIDSKMECAIQLIKDGMHINSIRREVKYGDNIFDINLDIGEKVSRIIFRPSNRPIGINLQYLKLYDKVQQEVVPSNILTNEACKTNQGIILFLNYIPHLTIILCNSINISRLSLSFILYNPSMINSENDYV